VGLARWIIANTLELMGIGMGDKSIPLNNTAELKGFRPYPILKIPHNLDHEWQVGFYWYLKRIEGIDILDTGYMAHKEFAKILGNLGLNVIGIDLQSGNIDKVNCIQAPVWSMPIPEASVDTLIANSLLEHLGLDCYSQPDKTNARELTLQEFTSVLKPGGLLLTQVPYSNKPIMIKHKGEQFYVPWTRNDFKDIGKYFTIEEKTYYVRTRGRWIEVSETIADRVQQGGGFPSCIVFIKARNKA